MKYISLVNLTRAVTKLRELIANSAYNTAKAGGYTGTAQTFEADLASLQGLADYIARKAGK